MPLLGFTVFKDKILDGSKTQTIRALRKRLIKKGDKLFLYWHTRQKDCEKLGEAICTERLIIQMDQVYWFGKQRLRIQNFDYSELPMEEIEEIIKRDGFTNADEMLAWFTKRYALPQVFQVIRWSTIVQN